MHGHDFLKSLQLNFLYRILTSSVVIDGCENSTFGECSNQKTVLAHALKINVCKKESSFLVLTLSNCPTSYKISSPRTQSVKKVSCRVRKVGDSTRVVTAHLGKSRHDLLEVYLRET